jgi:ArsR family transcriptional regulator
MTRCKQGRREGVLFDYVTVMKAAGDRTRARILKMLQQGELCVCQLMAVLGLSSSTVSKHLSILRIAGLVSDRRDGRWVYYALETHTRNPYARAVLHYLHDWLDDDRTVIADREKLAVVKQVPLEVICVVDGRVQLPANPEAEGMRRSCRQKIDAGESG